MTKVCCLSEEPNGCWSRTNPALKSHNTILASLQYLYFGYPVCFYFRWNFVDSSVTNTINFSFWKCQPYSVEMELLKSRLRAGWHVSALFERTNPVSRNIISLCLVFVLSQSLAVDSSFINRLKMTSCLTVSSSIAVNNKIWPTFGKWQWILWLRIFTCCSCSKDF